ncbi:MAG TPA: hypothetical protein VKA32_09395 [Gammaproteobacteria bacterium]|nr:hypothetical protein [Gammaproteobacteria bacterium]
MKVAKRLSLASVLVLVAGCAGLGGRAPYTVPEGSTLTLRKSVELPAGPFSIWIQDGRYALRAVDDYRPFCKLHGKTSSTSGVTLQPTRFRIVEVRYRYDIAAARGAVRVASLALRESGDDELTMIQTQMKLHSDEPTPLDTVTCMKRGFVRRDSFLSVEDIRTALGDYFTLDLPPQE